LEKGAALIRSFEAGTRTGMMGMMGMHGTSFKLQRLLMETAQQPDIVYLMVTDDEGTIQAHSNIDRIGGTYGQGSDLRRIAQTKTPAWRRVKGPDGEPVFEVFRAFSPIPDHPHHRRRPGMGRRQDRRAFFRENDQELSKPRVIFVGLDMSPFEKAQKEETRHTVFMAIILLLIGFAGFFTIFLMHGYRSAKKSLGRIQAFSDQVVENMPIGLAALDAKRKVATFNRTAVAVLGISENTALGRDAGEILPKELADLFEGPLENRMTEKEVSCTLSDGRRVPLDLSLSVLKGRDGEIIGELLLFRDMSEVRDLKREVERSRRLASVGRLAAGVAHEIRNPLSSIKGFATYFRERYRDVDEDRRTADIMIQEVDRLNRVIGQLLDFARPLAVEKRPVASETLIRHSVKMIEAQAKDQGVSIETRLTPELKELSVDLDRMGQVLLNLFLNALEAMPGGGSLTVETGLDAAGHRAFIRVSDTGAGIDQENIAHVFDPYFTTKSSGTGLGLAIVHKIVESHGGEISLESKPGKGTEVSIGLPL
jgi:two-component system sensor histidine kinase HydH